MLVCLSLVLAVALVVGVVAVVWVRALERARRADQAAAARVSERYEAARRARATADATTHAKDELFETLAHELRTPLNAVLSWATMLRAGQVPPEGVPRALEAIEQNAHAQARLIKDLQDVSRLVGGRPPQAWEPVDLGACLDTALGTVAPSAERKRLTLSVRREDRPVRVRGDAARLQQVLWNLLANAVKFTAAGGRIDVAVSYSAGEASVRITDTGAGISPEELPNIFERFSQGRASRMRGRGGLGLGLAIARHLVEAHGGSVSATSEGEGQGSTFVVRLPLEARETGETRGGL